MKALALAALLLRPMAGAAAAGEAPAPGVPPPAAVVATTPAPAPAAAPAPPAPSKVEWKGTVGAGLISMTGNSNTTTVTGSATASRETFGWILSAKASGAYGQNTPAGAARETTALNAAGQLRLDRKFGAVWTIFVLGGAETDHVASIEYRTLGEVGVGAQWLDRKQGDWQRLLLRTDLGFRYAWEARYQYYGTPIGPQPGVELAAPRLGLAVRFGFSGEVFLTEEAETLVPLTGASRVQARSVTKLSSRLTRSITLGMGYSVAFDSSPAAGKEQVDTALTALLEVGF